MEPALSSTILKFSHFFPASLQAKIARISKSLMIRLVPLKTKYLYTFSKCTRPQGTLKMKKLQHQNTVMHNANICGFFLSYAPFFQSCWYFSFGDYRGSLHHLGDGVKRVGSTAGDSQLTFDSQSEFRIPEATLRLWGQWWGTKGQY